MGRNPTTKTIKLKNKSNKNISMWKWNSRFDSESGKYFVFVVFHRFGEESYSFLLTLGPRVNLYFKKKATLQNNLPPRHPPSFIGNLPLVLNYQLLCSEYLSLFFFSPLTVQTLVQCYQFLPLISIVFLLLLLLANWNFCWTRI